MLGELEGTDHRPSDKRGMTPRVFEYLFSRITEVSLRISLFAEELPKYIFTFELIPWVLGGRNTQDRTTKVHMQMLISRDLQ